MTSSHFIGPAARRAAAVMRASVLVLLCCAATAARAAIVYDFNTEFSGGTPPSGPAPWLVATFSDTSTSGQVQLTITTSGLASSTKISGLYFNLDPDLNVSDLSFKSLNGGSGTVNDSSLQLGENAFMADGDGKYDILLSYPTSGATFHGGDTSSFDITYSGSGTFDAASFYFLSDPAGGHGPFYAAAHVLDTSANGGSGWVAPVSPVPLPPSLPLLATGLLGFAALTCNKSRRG
ncbi:MAG TPA: hypothetical protein VGR92_07960 [Steroidobacteraceae bacterium]|nr:hypothetical protein [Steroidobacteraceae bacterium]